MSGLTNIEHGATALIIERNCSRVVEAYKRTGRFLYRGMHDEETLGRPIFRGDSQKKRKPTDSNPLAQTIFDTCCKQLGAKAFRGNSIFTTADPNGAASYGQLYVVFPFDKASFTWSQSSHDLVLSLHDVSKYAQYTITKTSLQALPKIITLLTQLKKINIDDANNKTYFSDTEKLEFKTALTGAIKMLNPIIKAPTFEKQSQLAIKLWTSYAWQHLYGLTYAGTPGMQAYNMIRAMFLGMQKGVKATVKPNAAKEFQKQYKIDTVNLDAALKSDHSIWWHGSYIAIDIKHADDYIFDTLGLKYPAGPGDYWNDGMDDKDDNFIDEDNL